MKTLVKNGTIITSTNEFKADILIENEKDIDDWKRPIRWV